jgi:hypothetical protein
MIVDFHSYDGLGIGLKEGEVASRVRGRLRDH